MSTFIILTIFFWGIGSIIYVIIKLIMPREKSIDKLPTKIYEQLKNDIEEEIEDDDKSKPFLVEQKGELFQRIEKRAMELNDGMGERGALKHLWHLKKHAPFMETEKKWEQIKILWTINGWDHDTYNKFCKWIMEKEGWKLTIVDGYNDGGIDIKGGKTVIGEKKWIAIQCKQWKFKSIGENEISKFAGKEKVDDAKKAKAELVFITSSYYTQGGKKLANHHNIRILDYQDLIGEYSGFVRSSEFLNPQLQHS